MTNAGCDDVLFVMHVHSRPGVLAKIASMFHRRGLNIHTLTVGTTHAERAKMVARVLGPRRELERVGLAIDNLVDVLSVEIADAAAADAHELCLVRVAAADEAARARVLQAVQSFQPAIVEANGDSLVLRAVGAPAQIEELLSALSSSPVIDISRTGATTKPGTADWKIEKFVESPGVSAICVTFLT